MMVDKNGVLGFIPARGGSKSIPLKNIALLHNRPMIAYVVGAAKSCRSIHQLICSTDHKEIARVCSGLGVEVMERPQALALDDTHVIDVILHMLDTLRDREQCLPFAIALLQVTSPFLLPEHIDACTELLFSNPQAGSVQTITEFPHNYHAYNQRVVENGVVSFQFAEERAACYNKQKKPKFFVFGNLVVSRTEALLAQREVFAKPSLAVRIPPPYALDVDGPEDLELAEWYLEKRKVILPHLD